MVNSKFVNVNYHGHMGKAIVLKLNQLEEFRLDTTHPSLKSPQQDGGVILGDMDIVRRARVHVPLNPGLDDSGAITRDRTEHS